MKRIFDIATVLFAFAIAANAQIGVIGGFTSSKTNVKDVDLKSMNLYHAGIAYKFEIGPVFCIQPSLAYQVKGVNLQDIQGTNDLQLKTGFVELGAGLQLGIDLAVIRPFALVEPFIGYQVTGQEKWDNNDTWGSIGNVTNKFEYGFGLGGGIELFDHVQISAQWFKNLGALSNAQGSDIPDTVKESNYQGIKFTLGLFF